MLARVLLLILVVWLVSRWLRRPSGANARRPEASGAVAEGAESASQALMARCAHCGLHFPAEQALKDAHELSYCSEAHRQQGPHSGHQPP